MTPDFSGYATKNGLKCSDGRTIMSGAFTHNDGNKVPLVWQHIHNDPNNVLGHAVLEDRPDGVYAYGYFNDSPNGQQAKMMVQHGDIESLSIYANQLKEQNKRVLHGEIREVSLVLAGANPGALIDNVNVRHADGDYEMLDEEAVVYTGLTLEHQDSPDSAAEDEPTVEHAQSAPKDTDKDEGNMADKTVEDVYNTLTDEQKNLMYYMVGEALAGNTAEHGDDDGEAVGGTDEDEDESDDSDSDTDNSVTHSQEGTTMSRNVFDQSGTSGAAAGHTLTHADALNIFEQAKKLGSVKEAVEDYALKHGIEDIDVLFPDAKAVANTPEFLKRRTEWASKVLDGTRHTPFARIKSLMADLTPEEARAKGYIKGNMKREEFFAVSKRVTTPQTIYKKQKLDRDDILDITDFDVVAWLKGEMRIMLEEEIARAVLIGDGRSYGDDDKINEANIRPIASDDELYVTTINVNLDDASSSADEIIDALTLQRHHYRGSGTPKFFTSETILAKLLLTKDTLGRRIYPTVQDVAAALRVSEIVPVEVFEEVPEIVGILVDLNDYNIGSNAGGDVSLFDDFDIDYNQYKYLIETRLSGALVKPKSALVVKKVAATDALVVPTEPAFVESTGVVTIPTVTGVTYKNKTSGATLTAGAQTALDEGDVLTVQAVPASGKYFATNADDEWVFTGVTEL